MATPDHPALRALPRLQLGALAALLPQPGAALSIRVVEPLRVLSLRCLPGGKDALARAAGALPGAGCVTGTDPLLVWRSPAEWLYLCTSDAGADALLQALPAGDAPAQATDLSAGTLVIELRGLALDALIARLFDASVRIAEPGQGTRTRLADIAVVALRLTPRRLWLLADRANDHYLAHWLGFATADLPLQQ